MLYFVSDHHWGHSNVIRYCDRPYAIGDGGVLCRPSELNLYGSDIQVDVDAMNRDMVERWNRIVQPSDTVFHLGDFAMGPASNIDLFRAQLNGYIVLVRGNHDRSKSRMLSAGFNEVVDELETEIEGTTVYMHHQPIENFRKKFKYAEVHLCGHVHDAWAQKGDIYNVGVDVRDFKPVSLQEILDRQPSSNEQDQGQ